MAATRPTILSLTRPLRQDEELHFILPETEEFDEELARELAALGVEVGP